MSDEAAFLNAILEHPEDDAPRLVYADWLDERGDPASEAKAAFLRATAELALPGGLVRKGRRLCQAAREMDADWLAVVGKMPLESCPKITGSCPKRWERLRSTGDPRARFCDRCRKTVHFCATETEALDRALQGQPAVLSIAVSRPTVIDRMRGWTRKEASAAEAADRAIEEFEQEQFDERFDR